MRGWVLALLVLAGPAAADVVSPRAEAVRVTVYNDAQDGLAMIGETRTVDLPAGRSRLVFQGVADGIIPETAAVSGLSAKTLEQNFDFDLLTPGSLLQHAVGETVRLVRTNPRTGRVTEEAAVVRSAPNGVVLDVGGRIEALQCSGGPERLVLDHAPAGLASTPTLSMIVQADHAGRYAVTLAYLATGLRWSADYVARLAPDGQSLALLGWITLSNESQVSFAGTNTAVVAGKLSREWVEAVHAETVARTLACWPLGTTHSARPPPAPPPIDQDLPGDAMISEVIVTAERREESVQNVPIAISAFAKASDLGDYKLYALPYPTTLAAHQTKQVAFLSQPAVRFQTVYIHLATRWDPDADDPPTPHGAVRTLRFNNTADGGLGKPLPQGLISLRMNTAHGDFFLGEGAILNTPTGLPFEFPAGTANDITVTETRGEEVDLPRNMERRAFTYSVVNGSDHPAVVEIRLDTGFQGPRVAAESRRHQRIMGYVTWRIPLAPHASAPLTYTLTYGP